jgi:hypothetical protein
MGSTPGSWLSKLRRQNLFEGIWEIKVSIATQRITPLIRIDIFGTWIAEGCSSGKNAPVVGHTTNLSAEEEYYNADENPSIPVG